MPRKITLEFTCELDQCEYTGKSANQCITQDEDGDAWVCPNLTATVADAKPQTET